MRQIEMRYFNWLCRVVASKDYPRRDYHELLHFLHEIPFTFTMVMDGNRAADGIDLRYRFGYECNIEESEISYQIGTDPCSVLEMMVALSVRLESIMSDSDKGDRTSTWFWSMIENLGLGSMTNDIFDEMEVDRIIQRFLNRKYTKTGKGGLVRISRPRRDLRNVEIWYQMMWYLDEILKGEEQEQCLTS